MLPDSGGIPTVTLHSRKRPLESSSAIVDIAMEPGRNAGTAGDVEDSPAFVVEGDAPGDVSAMQGSSLAVPGVSNLHREHVTVEGSSSSRCKRVRASSEQDGECPLSVSLDGTSSRPVSAVASTDRNDAIQAEHHEPSREFAKFPGPKEPRVASSSRADTDHHRVSPLAKGSGLESVNPMNFAENAEMHDRHSDGGSSSCKDMDPRVFAPDSVPAMVAELQKLLEYVKSKPTLQRGSASFMRDYLRTMLIKSSKAAEEAVAEEAKIWKNRGVVTRVSGAFARASEAEHDGMSSAVRNTDLRGRPDGALCLLPGVEVGQFFRCIPDELSKHIFSFLDGENLAVSREVCRKWNEFACEDLLWKSLCLKRWRSLETDRDVWKLIDPAVTPGSESCWRRIYPTITTRPQWPCRLQKTGRFICNLVAHYISGTPLGPTGLPRVLVVERRFNILHLQTFVLPDASVLYFEPEQESDVDGFKEFIDYLDKRTRAGLALDNQRRFIFIPPCDYTRTQVGYNGKSLLGVIQNAYPPLAA